MIFFRQLLASLRAGPGTPGGAVARVWQTAVLWSWGLHILRLASVLLVLPLLTRLPGADFGFYYLVISVVAVTPLIDLGFSAAVERSVSYAMGGATKLTAVGLPAGANSDGSPNFELLWKLVHTARAFYRGATLLLIVVLGGIGTWIVHEKAPLTTNPTLAWVAWVIAFVNAAFEVYSSWWNVVLRGMNRIVASSRIVFLGQGLKVLLSCLLLVSGAGVLSIFAAGLVSSATIRTLSRRSALRVLPAQNGPALERTELLSFLKMLWPNSWRVGLQLVSNYITALLLALLCTERFGLAGNGQYGFSLNIATVIQGMASVWVAVKWPMIGQMRSRGDVPGMRRLLWTRIWLETLTFIALGIAALVVTPVLIKLGGLKKDVLPEPWFLVLLLNSFLETQMIVWGTFLITENKVPTLWPIAITNVATVSTVWLLLNTTQIGLGAFAVGPLLTGSLFIYWYFAKEGARNLRSSWFRYMFSRMDREERTRSEPLATTA